MLTSVQATRDPLDRLQARLSRDPDVLGLYVLDDGTECHVWVLLRRWEQDVRYRVYDAQEAADPAYTLHLHVAPDPSHVHPSAALVR